MNLIWGDIRLLFGKFASNWQQFLAIHLAVNVLIFVFFAPADTGKSRVPGSAVISFGGPGSVASRFEQHSLLVAVGAGLPVVAVRL